MSAESSEKTERRRAVSKATYRGMPRAQAGRGVSSRVIARFAAAAPLTIVRGPHGFGKSMLTAQWLRSLGDDVDVLWFGFEWEQAGPDTSAERFWSALADKLEDFSPQTRRGGLPSQGAEVVTGWDRVVAHFGRRTKPIYLVLDRYSELTSGALGIDHALTDLVRSNENLFLVVCTRDITSIEVVGSVMGDSLVLRPVDLALTVDDILVLAGQQSITLTREEAALLRDETGGWPALVRVILTGSAADRQLGDTFALNLNAGRWFLRSVWSEFSDPKIARFVVRTAFVGDFTYEIAQGLCGDGDPTPEIEAMVGAGLLHARQISSGTVVYSHLQAVRREVRQRLRTEDRAQYQELSSAAAALFVEDGQLNAALRFLASAKLWTPLLELIAGHWSVLSQDYDEELTRLVQHVPSEIAGRSPHLVAARAHLNVGSEATLTRHSLFGDGHTTGLGASLGIHPHAHQPGGPSGVRGAGSTGGFGPGRPLNAQGVALRYADLTPDVQEQLPAVLYQWALSKLMSVDPFEALAYFEEASVLAHTFKVHDMTQRCAVGAALVNVLIGEVDAAANWLESVDLLVDPSSLSSTVVQPDAGAAEQRPATGEGMEDRLEALAAIVRSMVAVGRLTSPEALDEVAHLPSNIEYDDLWALGVIVRSQVAILQGKQFELLDELESNSHLLSDRAENDLLRAMMVGAKVELLLSLGQTFRARAALSAQDHGQNVTVVPEARAAYMSGDFAKAARISSEALREGLRVPRIKLGVLVVLAAAETARGRSVAAAQAMREAVTVSKESGLVMQFAFMCRDMLTDFAAALPGMEAILAQVQECVPNQAFPAPTIVAELSEREREVLVALSKAQSLLGVARALYLTTNTVKTHLRSIYRKLDTHSAGETIQRAIECGLIEAPGPK